MKLFSLLCAAFVGAAVLAPATATAGHDRGGRSRVSYDRCGTPIYWVYTCVGHDRHGCPVFGWVQQSRGHGGSGRYGSHRGGYDRGGYQRGGHSRGGISFSWSR